MPTLPPSAKGPLSAKLPPAKGLPATAAVTGRADHRAQPHIEALDARDRHRRDRPEGADARARWHRDRPSACASRHRHPATTNAVLDALITLVKPLSGYDRVSVGFPGVVVDGVTQTAPNLDPSWNGFDLAAELGRRLHRTVRVLNDAGVQGYGVIPGHGVEMVLTLGTGLGCALYHDGVYVPNLELAHHPFRHGKTYEEYVGAKAMKKVGKKKWNKRVARVIAQVLADLESARALPRRRQREASQDQTPARRSTITSNVAGLLGGIALWKEP